MARLLPFDILSYLLFEDKVTMVNYLYSFWYICYYRQSAAEKAQFVSRWREAAAVKDCAQKKDGRENMSMMVYENTENTVRRRQYGRDGFCPAIRDNLAWFCFEIDKCIFMRKDSTEASNE